MRHEPPLAAELGVRAQSPSLDRVVAAALCIAIGLRMNLAGQISTALAAPVLLAPVWLHVVAPLRAKRVFIMGVAAIIYGLLLNGAMRSTHEISTFVTIQQTVLILEVVLGAGALVWCRITIGSAITAFWFGLGILAHEVVAGFSSSNVWKFDLFIPATLCLLALCWWRRNLLAEIVALAALAVVSALNDSRSASSILGMTALILVWQRWRAHIRLRSTAVRVLAGIALTGVFSYFVMQSFILDGLLGASSQARSEAQLQAAGSLLLGGRPELGATIALLKASPFGFGMGVVPNVADVNIAKSGMMAINYDPNNGYVERYMFGGGIEVHSVIGDLWLRCGLAGLVFALVMLGVIVFGAATRLANDNGRALTTFLAIQVTWDAMFSPFYYPAVQVLMLGVALLATLPQDPLKLRTL